MLTDSRFYANPWGFDNYYNPIPQDFTIHHQHGTTSSMSSEEANSSSPTSSPGHQSCQQPSFQYPSISNFQYPSLSDFQYPSMGMPQDGSQDDDEFTKFHQQFSNFVKTDDTNRRINDTNCKTSDSNFGQCKENCMAIDLSRTPDPNFNRFQEVIHFNNRFQEDLNFNNQLNRSVYPEFGCSVPHPEYSTYSVNESDTSLVIRNRQNSNTRPTPYQRLNGKNRRCSVTDDVSSSADAANPQRSLANDRERARTRNLNAAFAELRTHVPSMPSDKLSKIQTLKLASKYIHFLLQLLREGWDDVDVASWNCSRLLTHERLGKKFSMWRLQGAWSG